MPLRDPDRNSLRQGILLRPARLLSAFSISDKDLVFYPTGFPGKEQGSRRTRTAKFPRPSRELNQRIAAPLGTNQSAVCDAIAAIFATFRPLASSRERLPEPPGGTS